MRFRLASACGGLATFAALGACGPSGSDVEPLSREAYFERMPEAYCELEVGCGCDTFDTRGSCIDFTQRVLERSFDDEDAFGRPFDEVCAARQVQYYEERGCGSGDDVEFPGCALFEWTRLGRGESCTRYELTDTPCGPGLFCDTGSDTYPSRGRCVEIPEASVGDPCGPDVSPSTCEATAYCDSDSLRCVQRPALGEACIFACTIGSYCDEATATCVPWRAVGAACEEDSQCEGDCIDGVCSAPFC